ncbi:MAG: superoxide dismutase, Ni [Candidatus Levybacteria bacterium CG_4_10_14_0_2_um_filter_36_16]|nr:MAG: superoxide dismutase, Ni [Candidatus Levybacteria bacterium CG2_30_37_29]PIZ96321.1 MAG: superoxide dismutase, Ni [Candidatus Levybacteria bacterium CG_4_10_14_0_2_um_filter_36_16]
MNFKFLYKIFPHEICYAHCDVPCGIYDPKPAQIAAATVLKMVQKIKELPTENPSVNDRNSFVRMVLTKDVHAQKCKEELLILWTDYFKPEHLGRAPDMHERFWNAAKLCSKNKQTVDEISAQELIRAVDEIANIFSASKI